MMLELIAKTGIFFSQPIVLASVVLVGFLNRNEAIFGRTLLLLLFTMVYNVLLKSIWQIPLPPPLEGWAFPSGHMHSAVVFWGALAIEFRRFWFSALVVFTLCLTGYGLIYHGYHYPIDIIGSVGFGSLSLLIYNFCKQRPYFTEKPYRLGVELTSLAILCMIFMPSESLQKWHIWQALGALMGFTFGWFLLSQQNQALTIKGKQRLLLTSVALLGSLAFFYLIKVLPITKNPMIFCQFFLIAIWVSTSKFTTHQILRNIGIR
jgi:hypothetical protein